MSSLNFVFGGLGAPPDTDTPAFKNHIMLVQNLLQKTTIRKT
jgi:hypothetical protein